jgi:hypothetical protein
MSAQPAQAQGPKYYVNLEGAEYAWDNETITVSELRGLGGWDTTQPIVEVDLRDNTERTLAGAETVTLKPGHGFAKKLKFQRG